MTPVLHIVTPVLNGMPFIARQWEEISKIRGDFIWHVIEGVSIPIDAGGHRKMVQDDEHRGWRSVDGTSEFLDSITSPNVRVGRKAAPWKGVIEMANFPGTFFTNGDVIHVMDVDEFWTARQLDFIPTVMLETGSGKAWYWCKYYLGPDVIVRNRVPPGNDPKDAWIRTFVYSGHPFLTYEPPNMPFAGLSAKHSWTESQGLVFDHLSWVTEKQVARKCSIYSEPRYMDAWNRMNESLMGEAPLKSFGWPTGSDDAIVARTECNRWLSKEELRKYEIPCGNS